MSAAQIAVKYIGHRAHWEGTLYNVKLRFESGQTRPLPEALALKFLTHKDTFERDDAFAIAPKTPEQETQEALDAVQQAVKKDHEQTQEVYEVLDQVGLMDKDRLQDFASRYGTKLDGRRSIERLRDDVKQLVNLRGLV